jgi:PPOX class probable F420-dependent enzyme
VIDDDGRPRVLPVTFAVVDDVFVSAVDHKPKRVSAQRLARVRWLTARPQAALTVDHYEDDWSKLGWVQAIGKVELLAASAAPEAIAALVARYEPYRERAPAGPILALAPDRIVWWHA